ncbi:hypothetical protein JCM4814A_73950 [Streptomyces phaeofaciens JCM 4814]|uniref:DUF4232 domain-containing protein n=1 Tax=Streptomyces phaeofaciens TaxID=68254 RepID=A0A918HHX2_9ACTN|nr:DUF4232 domain-containing protein [Streptomyces phaeofaciens]GGT63468.1 hypothetical protein GCM10010226_46410 [Streptomyces phaeofaciens]
MRYGNRHGNGYGNGVRRAVVAMTAAVAVAAGTAGCQPGTEETGTGTSPGSGSSGSGSSGAESADAGSPGAGSPDAGSPDAGSPDAGSSGAAVTDCAADGLEVSARQAAERPRGTGTGAAVVAFTNVSGRPCVLTGHPSVAGAGNGSPQHNTPLTVTRTGSAAPVTVAAGGKAWVKLTFVQVQGEADGYCESGADPTVYPTLVVGLPGSGAHQVALDDGVFAECDDTVTVTPVSSAEPS